jgi:hypothetical protein
LAVRGPTAFAVAAEAAFHYRGRSSPPPATLCTGQGRIRPGWMIVLCVHANSGHAEAIFIRQGGPMGPSTFCRSVFAADWAV